MSDYLPKKLLVNYLPDHVTDELLRCIFGKYGALIEEQTHTIPQNRPKGTAALIFFTDIFFDFKENRFRS
jgi:hypothetical protein